MIHPRSRCFLVSLLSFSQPVPGFGFFSFLNLFVILMHEDSFIIRILLFEPLHISIRLMLALLISSSLAFYFELFNIFIY